ncbi:4-amino-4-deoxychorismate lyase [Thermodesulfobium acidiphilum]|uniref:4-amino-4-deoxychorismate lyase n=1 Tax=Thermodesulfobium acidiphilum TaxID=1794699 RepID=A0A2R4VYX4_THEAF|nr:aminotransferase class IV [Thermodesulfobium acidiphilum]AWB09722.1 4-amino-4-deoxychorismate lyase [Thermodesulfobium acidiphilum]
MCQFIETIKLHNSDYFNLEYHQRRIDITQKKFFGTSNIDLKRTLPDPEDFGRGIYKCRIIYGEKVESIDISRYSVKRLESLRLIFSNQIDYSYKFSDRRIFDNLKKCCKGFEEILIVKNNFVTDTSYSNIAFYKNGVWYTPESYLLNGTKRQFYLDKGILKEAEITVDKIFFFEKISLLNSMLDLGEICMNVKSITV